MVGSDYFANKVFEQSALPSDVRKACGFRIRST